MSELVAADLKALYRAGRETFPARAEVLSGACSAAVDVVKTLNGQSARAGDHPALANAVEVGNLVFKALRQATKAVNDCAVGLVKVADTFVATDEEAAEAFRRLRDTEPRLTRGAPREHPVPPHLDGDPTELGAPGVDDPEELPDRPEAEDDTLWEKRDGGNVQ